MAHGMKVSIGDSVEALVRHAGRPQSVEHDFGCIGSGCELQGFLEKWIFVHGDTRYRVGVFRDQVTSIEHEPLQQVEP
ncbi:MAG: hypothetical protein HWE39_22910 [Oceanospirillaceae bacterium]|nr:hypothetical protein [Oceanospirillaceae bacterium]